MILDIDDTHFLGRPVAYDKAGHPISTRRLAELRYAADGSVSEYARIGWDEIGTVTVSTVWLGTDHGWGLGTPIIFETMIFGYDPEDSPCERYCTEAAAGEGHRRAVEDLRAGLVPWFLRDGIDQAAEPCPVCRGEWHGLTDPLTGCPGELGTEVEIKEWRRRHPPAGS